MSVELDWRELDPYYNELQDCTTFWTFVNLVSDIVYSGVIILFVFINNNTDSFIYEGIQNRAHPILMYLILSLVVNYGALRSNQSNYDRCFLIFSAVKVILFFVTFGSFVFLMLYNVQDFFGELYLSLVIILACYNIISMLAIWSMYICNKYIHVNEVAQRRFRSLLQAQTLLLQKYGHNHSPTCDKCEINRSFAITIVDEEQEAGAQDDGDGDEEEHQEPEPESDFEQAGHGQQPISSSLMSVWTIHGDGLCYQSNSMTSLDKAEKRNCVSWNNLQDLKYEDVVKERYSFDEHLKRMIFGSIDDISNVQITL